MLGRGDRVPPVIVVSARRFRGRVHDNVGTGERVSGQPAAQIGGHPLADVRVVWPRSASDASYRTQGPRQLGAEKTARAGDHGAGFS